MSRRSGLVVRPAAASRCRPPDGPHHPGEGEVRGSRAPSAPQARRTRRPSKTERGASTGAKIFISMISAMILLVTGIAWQNLTSLTDGLTKQDLNVADAGEKPADGAIDILLVGMDSRTDSKGNPLPQNILNELQAGGSDDGGFNTDTLILLHIPNDSGKAYARVVPARLLREDRGRLRATQDQLCLRVRQGSSRREAAGQRQEPAATSRWSRARPARRTSSRPSRT